MKVNRQVVFIINKSSSWKAAEIIQLRTVFVVLDYSLKALVISFVHKVFLAILFCFRNTD